MLGFNGEYLAPVTGYYPLGNGHRAFNPSLMRFISPDRMSPFGAGGLNAYAYCQDDPVNFQDPSGQMMSARTSRWGPVKPPNPRLAGRILVGFHGSSNMHMNTLVKGPQKQFLVRSKYGEGFYVTPVSKMARDFANDFNEGGPRYMGTYEVAGQSKPSYGRVYAVYAKNIESWKLGVDYFYTDNNILVIKSSVFKDVVIDRQTISSYVTDLRTGEAYVVLSKKDRDATQSSTS
jgi:RHS repeat-associated protein